MRNDTQLSYRKAAIQGASPIGLVISLYDTLTGDFRRAADAMRKSDIETRCHELNHALLVIGQLEDWVDKANGGDLAQSLSGFYAYLRSGILEASIKKSPVLLEALIGHVLHVRSAWQQKDQQPAQAEQTQAPVTSNVTTSFATAPPERMSFSQSA